MSSDSPTPSGPHRRRPRYAGTHPRRFQEKYKEHQPDKYPETNAKVRASGKTPAGTHRPILLPEILEALDPKPGQIAVDCTLGYGGHAEAILQRLLPGGRLIGLDTDPLQLPKTEARLRARGFGLENLSTQRTNFAGLPQALAAAEVEAAHLILADLGVSSMQLDDPSRGFSFKLEGPLDMRMNPSRGQPASAWLAKMPPDRLVQLLEVNSDEPHAKRLAPMLAGRAFSSTLALADAIRTALPRLPETEVDLSVRRVFQALRIAVNDEFSALDSLLRHLPACLKPAGRVAILTFHSGEDRRVKHAFEAGLASGLYLEIAREIIRPSPAERQDNPRSAPAKLRWAIRAAA